MSGCVVCWLVGLAWKSHGLNKPSLARNFQEVGGCTWCIGYAILHGSRCTSIFILDLCHTRTSRVGKATPTQSTRTDSWHAIGTRTRVLVYMCTFSSICHSYIAIIRSVSWSQYQYRYGARVASVVQNLSFFLEHVFSSTTGTLESTYNWMRTPQHFESLPFGPCVSCPSVTRQRWRHRRILIGRPCCFALSILFE